jgi:hypothetical protein
MNHQRRARQAIEQPAYDFIAKFYAAYDLRKLADRDSGAIDPRTVTALERLLLDNRFHHQRQRLFLYREAAGVLVAVVRFGRRLPIAQAADRALRNVLQNGRDLAQRAAAEALGSLPMDIEVPASPAAGCACLPDAAWPGLIDLAGGRTDAGGRMVGRSIVADLAPGHIMVVKLARGPGDRSALMNEIGWMRRLSEYSFPEGIRFDIPRPLTVRGASLFRLVQLPRWAPAARRAGGAPLAIGFTVSDAYFSYPNPPDPASIPPAPAFLEVMGRSAFLLGHLAGRGIVHESPIALFHNRVQQERRRDGGIYEWYRAGRLDRWLDSCAYPNFGFSGLRDFEHLRPIGGDPAERYRMIGNHLLGLLLVAAGYFRGRDPLLRGWDDSGAPVDARSLFDADLLHAAVGTVFRRYLEGFTGRACRQEPPVDLCALVGRMVDEMGVDRHMEEFLRTTDQCQMSREDFEAFLTERGCTPQFVAAADRGERDLAIRTGPHLGAFNRGISIPELIEAVAAMAAVCVLERFLGQ